MKKIFYFIAAATAVAMLASCEKDNKGNGGEGEEPGTQVSVATENLVLYLPFEDGSVATGEGVSFDKKAGKADFVDGFIGKAYTNTAADPATEAYLKYNLASSNFINNLESFTFSAWVKRPANGSGALFSVNGGTSDWGSTMQFFFDNYNVNEETQIGSQGFNGRIDMPVGDSNPAFWPNVSDPAFAVVDDWFHVVRTYDAATSAWNVYVNGVKIGEGGTFTYQDEPLGALNITTENMNAFYIGAWAAIVEGVSTQSWMTYFNGSIDEVRMYNKALTDAEITQLYKEEALISLE